MFPQPMSRSELHPDDSAELSNSDLTRVLEQHLRAGFPPDLALDLVLNELVVRAAEATRATAAALALVRGDQMVCRAATGHLAPDLGVPLNTRDGLSGACLQTRQPQLSVDTEFDPRIDPAVSRRLGIRSILIVPVFEKPVFEKNDKNARFTGVLEVFSTSPAAFSHNDQKILEDFAEECARIRQAAIELSQRKPPIVTPELLPPDFATATSLRAIRPAYETWTLALGGVAILFTIAVSFLIGYRIGWLSPRSNLHATASNQTDEPPPSESTPCGGTGPGCPAGQSSTVATKAHNANGSPPGKASVPSPPQSADELVVYEKGKVVFRMKPAPAKSDSAQSKHQSGPVPNQQDNPIVKASSTTKIGASSVWLSPAQAETRLLSRTEPQYPPEALAAHRAGNIILEVQVAEDGSVYNVRTMSGDPLLAAAAIAAVRTWRYQPYRPHDRPAQFQTDVTLSFTLPN
jgi:TonB family protein